MVLYTIIHNIYTQQSPFTLGSNFWKDTLKNGFKTLYTMP